MQTRVIIHAKVELEFWCPLCAKKGIVIHTGRRIPWASAAITDFKPTSSYIVA